MDLRKVASVCVKGVFLGTVVTSIFQSSTAITVMTTGLVDAGLITFRQSLGLIFGANIGTTITSQLIALNIVAIAPFIIILGFFVTKYETGDRVVVTRPSVGFPTLYICSENPQVSGLTGTTNHYEYILEIERP